MNGHRVLLGVALGVLGSAVAAAVGSWRAWKSLGV